MEKSPTPHRLSLGPQSTPASRRRPSVLPPARRRPGPPSSSGQARRRPRSSFLLRPSSPPPPVLLPPPAKRAAAPVPLLRPSAPPPPVLAARHRRRCALPRARPWPLTHPHCYPVRGSPRHDVEVMEHEGGSLTNLFLSVLQHEGGWMNCTKKSSVLQTAPAAHTDYFLRSSSSGQIPAHLIVQTYTD
ncbi:hypothetical protein VPH35_116931 [Triticum aestivum]